MNNKVIGPYSEGIQPYLNSYYVRTVMQAPEDPKKWAEYAHEQALWLVENVNWPWTERQKRQWYIGVLAGWITREALEAADIAQLQEWHRETSK